MSVGFKLFGSESIYFDTSRQSSLDTSYQLNPFSSFFSSSGVPKNFGDKGDPTVFTVTSATSPAPGPQRRD